MTTAQQLLPCVPGLLVHRALREEGPPLAPGSECFPAAVLLADVSGFTPLTERLAQRGAAGAEELSRLLEKLFAPLVDVVVAHGGDILHFPGDALLALWPARAGTDLTTAARLAAECGLALQQAMLRDDLRDLSLRVAVAAGDVQVLIVGGVQGRWQALVRGEPFTQLRDAEHVAGRGQVVASPEAWPFLSGALSGTVLGSGAARVTSVLARTPVRVEPLPAVEALVAALGPFVSRAMRAAQEVGTRWLAELRRATVLFLRLDGLPENAADALLPCVSEAVLALQEAIYSSGGSVNQLLVDDKGMVLVDAAPG